MAKPRLEELYASTYRMQLKDDLKLDNIMQVPKLEKIVINIGVKDAVADSKALQIAEDAVMAISGQKVVRTRAKKSIAGFKIREGMPLGVKVTLRSKNMYYFLDKLISVSLPTVRDFRGVSTKCDGRGNYNLGIKEWVVFPELDLDSFKKVYGLNITIHTSAKNDEQSVELLKKFGMPFVKST